MASQADKLPPTVSALSQMRRQLSTAFATILVITGPDSPERRRLAALYQRIDELEREERAHYQLNPPATTPEWVVRYG